MELNGMARVLRDHFEQSIDILRRVFVTPKDTDYMECLFICGHKGR